MNVLGISALYHDAAVALVQDGQLRAAAHEERFTRRRNDASMPRNATRWLLRDAGLSLSDIDVVAFYEQPKRKLARQLQMVVEQLPRVAPGSMFRLDAGRAERDIREVLGLEAPIEYVDHHRAHAASAFLFAGVDAAATMTVDAVGETTTTAYGRASRDEGVQLFEEVAYPHSLGLLYSAVTRYLGFEPNSDEYKVMGLAPYGAPAFCDTLADLVQLDVGGGYRITRELVESHWDGSESDVLARLLSVPPRSPESPLEAVHMDIAASIQRVIEQVVVDKATWLRKHTDLDVLCYAGGVALNCVANAEIRQRAGFRSVHVPPAAGDAGAAVGAAAAVVDARGQATGPPSRGARLGPRADASSVRAALGMREVPYVDLVDNDDRAEQAAKRLAAGGIGGWCVGRQEFGPRALGARSILADPRDGSMRERINALVKKREAFRPFAPAVAAERTERYFEYRGTSPYMVDVAQVRPGVDLPAITHVDGSARLQTVSAADQPEFHRLIEAFESRTGVAVLLNTSFNMRGEPIVRTAREALRCAIRCTLDFLVVEDLLLDIAQAPADWRSWWTDSLQPPAPSISTYTFF